MRRLVLFLGCAVTGAFAETFEFSKVQALDRLSLTAYYVFHVYADAVGTKVNEKAEVTFRNFEISPSLSETIAGIQVSLVPRNGFFSTVDKTHFCSTTNTVRFQGDTKRIPLFNPAQQKEVTIPITATGEYLLVVTNCGKDGANLLKGQVAVKQPHGYLPGNKISTLHWWGWFTLVNAFLSVVWIIAVARFSSTLLYVQKVLTGLVLTTLMEGVVQYVLHQAWNNSGSENMVLFWLAMTFYTLKYLITLRVLMHTGSGAGVVTDTVATHLGCKMDIALGAFFAMQLAWKSHVTYKYRFMLSQSITMLITVPGTLLWLFLFLWVYRQFHMLSATLQDKNLASEVVKLFINVRLVLVGAFLLATMVLLLQVADMWLASTPWNLQWLPYDGAPHMVYSLFLLVMMILWWPSQDSWKLAYSDCVDQQETEAGGGEAHRDKGEQIEAEQIGATSQKVEEL
jgi:hypothetical protein